jgi:hypothetical protein
MERKGENPKQKSKMLNDKENKGKETHKKLKLNSMV